MKNKFLLWAASVLFVITGCTTDVIVDEKPVTVNGRKITLTASMPNEASQTRLSLEQEAGTKNITVKWKAGDVVQFFFKQDATLVAGTPRNVGRDRHYYGREESCLFPRSANRDR